MHKTNTTPSSTLIWIWKILTYPIQLVTDIHFNHTTSDNNFPENTPVSVNQTTPQIQHEPITPIRKEKIVKPKTQNPKPIPEPKQQDKKNLQKFYQFQHNPHNTNILLQRTPTMLLSYKTFNSITKPISSFHTSHKNKPNTTQQNKVFGSHNKMVDNKH